MCCTMRILTTFLLALFAAPLYSDQFLIPNFRESQDVFWAQLYPGEGWSLYCGEFFDSHDNVTIEYIYPIMNIAAAMNCSSVEECRSSNGQFNRIEADLHNMYPALKYIVEAREDYKYGLINGEFREFFECDFEHDVHDKIVEPRPIARGNIARAVLYMHTEYKLPLDPTSVQMFKDWNQADLPSKDEMRRNDVIEKLQGTRNPYIDDPKLAESIQITIVEIPQQRESEPVETERPASDQQPVIESF